MGQWLYGGPDGPIYVSGPGCDVINWEFPISVTATGVYTMSPEPKSEPVDAHAQMLAARVEGLEKDVNSLQHVWGRVKALESEVARLSSDKIVPPDAAYNLLRRCLNEVSPVSLLARDIAEFLRNR
jgi:hypothetical protein